MIRKKKGVINMIHFKLAELRKNNKGEVSLTQVGGL